MVSSPLESAIETELVMRVRAAGGRCEKVTVLGNRGFFDRLVVLPGKGGRLSPHQIERHRVYTALGAVIAIVANSADIDRLLND
jgi:hypothetical protein